MSPLDLERLTNVLMPYMLQTRQESLWLAQRLQEGPWRAGRPNNPPTPQILALGVWRGGVAALLAAFGHVVAVNHEFRPADRPWALPEYRSLCPDAQIEMVVGDAGDPATFRQVIRKYDLVFIGGNHDLRSALRDWCLYGQLGQVVVLPGIAGYNHLSRLQPERYGPPTIWSVLHENTEKQGIAWIEECVIGPATRGLGIAYRLNGIER